MVPLSVWLRIGMEHAGVGGRDWENMIEVLSESESKKDGDEGRRDKQEGKLRCQWAGGNTKKDDKAKWGDERGEKVIAGQLSWCLVASKSTSGEEKAFIDMSKVSVCVCQESQWLNTLQKKN